MALLLCKKRAREPYMFKKLQLSLGSLRELCYVIRRWPALCMDGLLTDELIRWLSVQLGEEMLADRLSRAAAAGEEEVYLLSLILEEGDCFTPAQIKAFQDECRRLKTLEKEELKKEIGRLYLQAGRPENALAELSGLPELFQERRRNSTDPAEKSRLSEEEADCYAAMAEIHMLLSDSESAAALLERAKTLGTGLRAQELQYLLDGSAGLPEESRKAMDALKASAAAGALESRALKEVESIFTYDDDKSFAMAEAMISNWKNEYRRMNR